MKRNPTIPSPITVVVFLGAIFGLSPNIEPLTSMTSIQNDPATEEKWRRFEEMLSGVRLVGKFSIVGGQERPLEEESYTIDKVTKLPDGDFCMFEARIQYGERDVKVPLRLEVKWAGDTPMITLTDAALPGLGTFSSRVLFYNGKYAGTWSHGEVGGHLFGVIEKIAE